MESVAGFVLWAALAVVLLGWVPTKVTRSMIKADEHRQDRFSTSMHILSLNDVTRPGDVGRREDGMNGTYGARAQAQTERETRMQSHSTSRLTDERIKEIRSLRRAGIRRRRILVVSLMLVNAVVLGLSFAFRYSAAWTLIPFVLLVVVLALGARAGAQAKAWEAKVSRMKAEERARKKARDSSITVGRADVTPTKTMSKEELKRMLRQRAAEREMRVEREEAERQARQTAAQVAAAAAAAAEASAQATSVQAHDDGNAAGQVSDASARPAQAVRISAGMDQIAAPDPLYAETDAAPMAEVVGSVPELISFSLGQARDKALVVDGPESAPIKSLRQVAVAVERDDVEPPAESMVDGVPVSALRSTDAVAGASVAAAGVDGDSVQDGRNGEDGSAAHDGVEAPEGSVDSLGVDVDSVMARRRV